MAEYLKYLFRDAEQDCGTEETSGGVSRDRDAVTSRMLL